MSEQAGPDDLARLRPSREREHSARRAVTFALYRYRYDVTGSSPVGEAQGVRTPEQAAEHRTARSAFA